jgi:tape measure domain-containing protein
MANSFANLVASLNLNIQNFSTNLRRASTQANQFAANLKGQINGGLVEPAKRSKFEFKDVARIVQGILISKAFYSGLNAIRNCTNAVWEFSQELEYAKIAYSNLFGDAALAEEFINVLEDFAATTPFSFSESEAAAKRLLAYGIEYKNVMYVMQGVLAASTMQNNPQVIESASRAIGQIYTKGRLMNEEMRQLAEAGIPAYEILAEKLGLTQEQLQSLGKQAIPASTAINALVEGISERFGGVVTASTTTMRGVISNIKDNALMIASGIFEPMYSGIKSVLAGFGQFLFTLRDIYATAGVGGVFETIFPKELHGTLRQFIANFMNLIRVVRSLIAALGGALKPVLEALLRVFNAFAPIIIIVANLLSALIAFITDNATAMKALTAMIAAAATMWVIFKIKALSAAIVAGVVTLISKALKGLSLMLTFVTAHPFWSLLIALGGLLVGLSSGFGKLSNSISGVFKKLTSIGGVDPDKLLLPSQEERVNDLNKFNEALTDTSASMDDLADSTGNATKAAKGLLSFDEVYKLNSPDEGTNSGIDTDIEMPDFSGLGEALIPDIPDFSDFIDGFTEDLFGGIMQRVKQIASGSITGALVGGLAGFAIGGLVTKSLKGALAGAKLGAKIGAVAGTVFTAFWGDSYAELEKALITTGAGMGVGAVIGAVAGFIVGAFATKTIAGATGAATLGAKIGASIGGVVGLIFGDATTIMEESIGQLAMGSSVGLLVGAVAGLIIGAFATKTLAGAIAGAGLGANIGTAIGGVVAVIFGQATSILEDTISKLTAGAGIGTVVGAVAGLMIGAFSTKSLAGAVAGAKIGAGIGVAAGGVIGLIFDDATSALEGRISQIIAGASEGLFVGALTGLIIGAFATKSLAGARAGARVGGAVGSVLGSAISGVFSDAEVSLETSMNNMFAYVKAASRGAFVGGLVGMVIGAIIGVAAGGVGAIPGAKIGARIGSALGSLAVMITEYLSNSGILDAIGAWLDDLWDSIWSKLTSFGTNIANWWNGLWSDKDVKVSATTTTSSGSKYYSTGHAVGGVFNREHIARFAEGNKAEAIIPLENQSAMQPFVDAVANGLTATLMPLVANISGGQQQLQPLYVGTLIADERSLRELERKMQIIRMQETKRRG